MQWIRPVFILIVLFLWGGLFVRSCRIRNEDIRFAILKGLTVLGLLCVAITEGLSLFHLLSASAVALLWLFLLITGAVILWKRSAGIQTASSAIAVRDHLPVLMIVACTAAVLAVIAVCSAPNNYDSMTYRLPRIMHWISNESLSFYPTHVLRQVYQPPGAEFLVMHLQLLSGGDRLSNLVQYFAMIGSVLGASHIVKLFQGSSRSQFLSALLVITIPMGILQSTSTQNDYVVSFWLVCFVNFLLVLREKWDLTTAFFCGGALGLALLTKFTAYFYALPLLIWFAWDALQNREKSWKALAAIAVLTLVINSGMYLRNFGAYGNPLGPGQENADYKFTNGRLDPKALISGVVRSTALHLGCVPSRWWRGQIAKASHRIHDAIGVDENDPLLTWPETKFAPAFSLHEDSTGNFVHFLLIPSGLVLLYIRQLGSRRLIPYSICLLAGFILFCWIVRWSPARTRMHLSFFTLMMPALAVGLDAIRVRVAYLLLIVGLTIQSLPYLFMNQARPLFGSASILSLDRTAQYFANNPLLQIPYYRAARVIQERECKSAGLIIGGDDYEYPLWALTDYQVRFEHIQVTNATRNARPSNPCVVVLSHPQGSTLSFSNSAFRKKLEQPPLTVFIRD